MVVFLCIYFCVGLTALLLHHEYPVLCRVCFASCLLAMVVFDVFTHVGYYCCVVMSTMHRVCFANCLLAMVVMGCI